MDLFFPELSGTTEVKEYYEKLKRRIKLSLINIRQRTDERIKEIEKLDEEMFLSHKIKNFFGAKGAEVQSIKQFEETCILMNQVLNKDAKKMSVIEYLQANEILNKQRK